jgi:O-antigen ligase
LDNKYARIALILYLLLGTYCIVRTGSRGAFVGLVLWIALAIATSRYRFTLGTLMVVLLPFAWFLMPPELQTRFETIVDPSVGPRNAQYSAEGRIAGLTVGYELLQNNPVTGIGPGAWRVATGRELESHNLYGQMMGETGCLGILTFLGILGAYAANLRVIRREYAAHPSWVRDLPFALTGSIGFAVFLLLLEGNFGHNLYRYSWPWFSAFLAVARDCVDQRAREEAEAEPVGEPEPLAEDVAEDPQGAYSYAGFGEEYL